MLILKTPRQTTIQTLIDKLNTMAAGRSIFEKYALPEGVCRTPNMRFTYLGKISLGTLL
jgi:hypothetical protein